jgi:hypothetical protein
MQLETMDGTVLAAIGEKSGKEDQKLPGEDDDGGIEFDRSDEKEDEESDEDKEIDIDDI